MEYALNTAYINAFMLLASFSLWDSDQRNPEAILPIFLLCNKVHFFVFFAVPLK